MIEQFSLLHSNEIYQNEFHCTQKHVYTDTCKVNESEMLIVKKSEGIWLVLMFLIVIINVY